MGGMGLRGANELGQMCGRDAGSVAAADDSLLSWVEFGMMELEASCA